MISWLPTESPVVTFAVRSDLLSGVVGFNRDVVAFSSCLSDSSDIFEVFSLAGTKVGVTAVTNRCEQRNHSSYQEL